MESDYDRKFKEMKMYIPFLENMIKRLETTSTSATNPRQAQLDKIRSLRDLLLDKKKRMKMDNLLKCEQVLINLYSKVEQTDTLPGIKKASEPLFPSNISTETQKTDLNSARNKLRSITPKSKIPQNDPDTLPEIAPASQTEEVCTPGSKEPALFQRRPNKNSKSPTRKSLPKDIIAEKKSPQKVVPKRNYTRVLVSPEPRPIRWITNEDTDKPLFSRRSPNKSSPQKKEKKKSSKSGKSKAKDLNITLNVPEESLDSLNTDDILSRIIRCNDDDVDIDTLRDLKTQILKELKQTGATDDISDLILKSYKKKKRYLRKREEVEEGELSDSESEAIESIYGSLVIVNKEKNVQQSATTSSNTDNQARKIQISLVIKPEKEETAGQNKAPTEVTDFEMFDIENKDETNKIAGIPKLSSNGNVSKCQKDSQSNSQSVNQSLEKDMANKINISPSKKKSEDLLTIEVEDDDDIKKVATANKESKDSDSSYIDISSSDTDTQSPDRKNNSNTADGRFTANFYNEHKEVEKDSLNLISSEVSHSNTTQNEPSEKVLEKQAQEEPIKPDETCSVSKSNIASEISSSSSNQPATPNSASINKLDKESEMSKRNEDIPLLDTESAVTEPTKKDGVSEIDILQALKNEILSESIAIPGTDVATPLLHQPKVTKVASAQEIRSKKRISLENYKKKSVSTPKAPLFLKDPTVRKPNENTKKNTSLKLTEQEQQRFNFLPLPLDSSDDEDNESTSCSVDDIYKDLAPRSPENNDTASTSAPIIIPVDPVKPTIVTSKADVDMRTLIPMLSPNPPKPVPLPFPTGLFSQSTPTNSFSDSKSEKRNEKQTETRRPPLLDPRVRRDFNKPLGKDSPNPYGMHPEKTPLLATPNMTSVMTPNSRSFEMTPSRQSFELDDISSRKHVYAPFPTFEPRDQREQSVNRDAPGPRWEPNSEHISEERTTRWDTKKDTDLRDSSRKWDDRDQRGRSSRESYNKPRYDVDKYHEKREDYPYSRIDCPRTPVHPFGRSECPTTPNPSFGRIDAPINPFGRSECPTTPIHPFGRSDCPSTPSHPFGRSECPTTPLHPFGRADCPLTPSHPFGRSEVPMTPNHPFGRSDMPSASHTYGRSEPTMTPNHPFGRNEAPMTPSHPFGRSEPPMTPNHPFGRPDMNVAPATPSHPFGRSDYRQNQGSKAIKDPRLNRTEYDSRSRKFDEDRDRSYYEDRRKSDSSHKYNRSESYQHYREQSSGRNERSKFNSDRTAGQEPSIGRSLSRDYDNERLYTRDRGSSRSNEYRSENEKVPRNYNEIPRRDYQRGQSVGRSGPTDDRFQRSSSKGPTDDRFQRSSSRGPRDNYAKESTENTLSVKPKSGRSFTIDTSVNTTFQEFLNGKGLQVFDYSFDSRRQRAASVGRTLTREASVGRNIREGSVGRTVSKPVERNTMDYKRMVNFVRARSMGRELVDKTEKSFKEIKADLKSFKPNYTINKKENEISKPDKKSNYQAPRSRKDQHEKQMERKNAHQSNKKTAYSPRKNCRDPRMHRDQQNDSKNKGRYEDKKNYGIVYSSDNIAKGTILGSGYGVKNYRIPKIKKAVEEKETKEHPVDPKIDSKKEKVLEKTKTESKPREIEVIKKQKESSNKSQADVKKGKIDEKSAGEKNLAESKTNVGEKNLTKHSDDDSASKRITRRSKLSEPLKTDEQTITKSRKVKKAVINSDSESEIFEKERDKNEDPKTHNVKEIETKNEDNLLKESDDKKEDNILNSSFGIDDLEIFPEHLNADPVLDNINALIADLDNDIDTTKAEDFTKDISFANMFESIDSPEVNVEESLQDISKVIKNLDPNIVQSIENNSENQTLALTNPEKNYDKEAIDIVNQSTDRLHSQQQCEIKDILKEDKVEDATFCQQLAQNQLNVSSNTISVQDNTVNSKQSDLRIAQEEEVSANNETDVSTTRSGQIPLKKGNELNEDRSSTPDSTLDTSPTVMKNSRDDEGLPDSTNEKKEMHPDVSSTRDQVEVSCKETEVSSEKEHSVSSIGNLLSILQDKSKIKELLTMLGDDQSADTDKIKKKLEKLSEIVSDDDDNDGPNDDITEKKPIEKTKLDTEDTIKTNTDITLETHDKSAEDKKSLETDTLHITKKNESKEQTVKSNTTGKKPKKTPLKRGKKGKWKSGKKSSPVKRVTRSGTANKLLAKPKKPSRELRQLQESIKEMFIKDDILNATGIRMCRLSKLVDEKTSNLEENTTQPTDPKPVVVIEKFKETAEKQETKLRKKPGPKGKTKLTGTEDNVDQSKEVKSVTIQKYKPGPKSKTKNFHEDSDPYSFDDSVSEATTTQTSEHENDSETEDESLASTKSFESSEVLAELKKKPKRKKRGWQSGIIKKRRKKNETKEEEPKQEEPLLDDSNNILPSKEIKIPDMNCFTDKSYCFLKKVSEYPCRLCEYNGPEIVKHYKTEHPHTEIPLSRMNAVVAREAVEQCEDINFQAISKMPTEKYICRFCFEEFNRKQNVLEEFFWHVVSMHTGEYKRLCSECVNMTRCPFNLDIPPPPKDLKGQLIGYICGKCNFTQISLENLKSHVIVRHNDEQTAVYTINLAVMSKKTISNLMKRCNAQEQAREPRSLRSKAYVSEKDEPSDCSEETNSVSDVEALKKGSMKKGHLTKVPVQSKLAFESDDNISETGNTKVKVESEEIENDARSHSAQFEGPDMNETDTPSNTIEQDLPSSDILRCPHFKVTYASNGTKEYVCCINGTENHYKTHLLISMKKHVQTKHSEIWDGYCCVCKVIVMPQGGHRFKECLQHMLDKHMDNFPVLQETGTVEDKSIEEHCTVDIPSVTSEKTDSPLSYLNVRPLTDLLTPECKEAEAALPKIQSVVSLGTNDTREESIPDVAPPVFKCPLTVEKANPKPEEPYKYEEMQAEVMSKKHLVILQSMLSEEKLVHIFKCAGRFCSFTTDSADSALLHASTHQRIGGENALLCTYCDYDCKGNAIDLVMHVFKAHGRCPYVCGHCFYRAVAPQLVLAHIHRVHGGIGGIVFETTTVTPVNDDSADMLPREAAVQHYMCGDAEKTCKFKTYTQGKFIEHMMRHTAPYLCYYCSLETSHPTELLHHMKTHGLKMYQCTWCVDGGDNEGDFLGHSSSRHPTRQPQAYLRIITNNQKGGASKTMVLPLVKLNKSSVPTHVVTPQSNTSNPASEAEKALEMEQLIAAMPTLPNDENLERRAKTPVQIPNSQISPRTPNAHISTSQLSSQTSIVPIPISQLSPQMQSTEATAAAEIIPLEQARLVTPPPSTSVQVQSESLPLTPIIKTEPVDESPEKNLLNPTIICLDSDEEESRDAPQAETDKQNVIDLSDDDDKNSNSNADKYKKVSLLELFKCSNCNTTFKSMAGFKRHVISCCYGQRNYTCSHCSFKTEVLDEFFVHYNDHSSASQDGPKSSFSCGICNRSDRNLWAIKNHVKKDHGCAHLSVSSSLKGNSVSFVVTGTTRAKPGPKRKLSGGSGGGPESSPKRVRYGAQDLHNLPQKPILDELAYCSECEFSTKVRLNLVRHIQQHANNQLVSQTAPVNPVPHLETNEKHFDRMINLASSSLEIARVEKATPSVTLHIPPEAASRYPKYVPDRQRHTCGAKGCSYISVDEAMLKCHWETLHAGSNDFHCVHCPPYQYLDTSKPLTASRIIAHLKMHDIRLYACSSCTYYHYRKQVVEKHLAEVHKGAGQLMTVREESISAAPVATPQAVNAAPTMDLKPWKCGLCPFKSMLRPEVIEHCSKIHSTKMQFKCPVCPFRTSTLENVTKHQANSHPENNEDVFYYYYREGSVPDEKDGTPRWMKQRQKMGHQEPEVKTEEPESAQPSMLVDLLKTNVPQTTSFDVNLDIVKEEIIDPDDDSLEALCRKYGEICAPNGLKYKCPLCKLVTEEEKETMQSHLYEELQYRKWACSICCYKAFHKNGLNEHMLTEHRLSRMVKPIELDADTRVERWVNSVLTHQTSIIAINRSNLAKQKMQAEKPSTSTMVKNVEKLSQPTESTPDAVSEKETDNLIQAFGQLGTPNSLSYCCPKCVYQTGDESEMKDHLETELNKIRWRCSSCGENAQNYHEAQLHSKTCKTVIPGQASRPMKAIKDPAVRAAWVAAVIRTQKQALKQAPQPEPETMENITTLENSLLVVRYEERVPTPEVEMVGRRKRPAPVSTATSPDSDDERLVIDEPFTDDSDTPRRSDTIRKCSYCPFATKYQQQLEYHVLRHYNLKPMTCCYCEQTFYYSSMETHMIKAHPNLPKKYKKTPVPSGPPVMVDLPAKNKGRKRSSSSSDDVPKISKDETKKDDGSKLICLVCEMAFSEAETKSHSHDKPTYFAKKGEVVVKCCICLLLFPNINLMQDHNSQCHPNTPINYAYFKLNHSNREIIQCGHCTKRFKFFKDYKSHHNAVHSGQQLKYESRPYYPGAYDFECETEVRSESSKTSDSTTYATELVKAAKTVARKSTTKLPNQTVARKSTTKLPFNIDPDSEHEDYSYYGSKPASLDEFENVTTLMPIFNTKISLQKLSEIIKINPVVLVKDCKK